MRWLRSLHAAVEVRALQAWGRDYADVAPIHGIVTGGSEHEVDVAVDVLPISP